MSGPGRGGARAGSGRKVGSRSAEPTKVVRLPVEIADIARRMAERGGSSTGIGGFLRGEVRTHATAPLVSSSVACGFPSPAEDHLEGRLDMNEFHNIGGTSTFMVRVIGESMRDAGMLPGDVVVVDLSLASQVRQGDIIVACLNGEFTLKRYLRKRGRIVLHPENPAFPDIEVPEEAEFQVWGVVTSSARAYKR